MEYDHWYGPYINQKGMRGMGVTERWRGIFGLKGDKDLVFSFGQKFAG